MLHDKNISESISDTDTLKRGQII